MFTDRQGELIFQSPVFSQYLKTKINIPIPKTIIKTNTSIPKTVSKPIPLIPRVLILVHAYT